MSRSVPILVTAVAFVLALVFANSSKAQHVRGDDGTGGAAGYSPPIDSFEKSAPGRSRSIRPVQKEPTPDPKTSAPSTSTNEKQQEGLSPDESANDK
jgi:hypothetical protein